MTTDQVSAIVSDRLRFEMQSTTSKLAWVMATTALPLLEQVTEVHQRYIDAENTIYSEPHVDDLRDALIAHVDQETLQGLLLILEEAVHKAWWPEGDSEPGNGPAQKAYDFLAETKEKAATWEKELCEQLETNRQLARDQRAEAARKLDIASGLEADATYWGSFMSRELGLSGKAAY